MFGELLETEDCIACGEPCDPDENYCERHVEEADAKLEGWDLARPEAA